MDRNYLPDPNTTPKLLAFMKSRNIRGLNGIHAFLVAAKCGPDAVNCFQSSNLIVVKHESWIRTIVGCTTSIRKGSWLGGAFTISLPVAHKLHGDNKLTHAFQEKRQ